MRLCAKTGFDPATGGIAPPVKVDPSDAEPAPAAATSSEPALDEETQRYVTQALTDVDLFSSYGLTQKAIDLLESALERAPRHAPILERLLDLSVGAGNDRRTAELASMLEQIATGTLRPRRRRALRRISQTVPEGRGNRSGGSRRRSRRTRRERTGGICRPDDRGGTRRTRGGSAGRGRSCKPTADRAPWAFPCPSNRLCTKSICRTNGRRFPSSWRKRSSRRCPRGPAAEPQAIPEAVAQIPGSSRTQEEVAEEVPAFDLELQPVTLSGAAENEALSGDAMIAGLAADMESATRTPGTSGGNAASGKSRGAAAFLPGQPRPRCSPRPPMAEPRRLRAGATLLRTDRWATCSRNFAPNWAS